MNISVRLPEISDYEKIVDYFLNSEPAFLVGMGVDRDKLPSREEWLYILAENHKLKVTEKKFFYLIWLIDKQAVGHSNINKIENNTEAFMHLHIWTKQKRLAGLGEQFLKLTIPYYFETYNLKNLYCEPSASNAGPNKTLQKLGFEHLETYNTIPGWINFHQTVNRWCLTKDKFELLYRKKKQE
jgi:RimJ/RimL family protein N-acetyltransferase